MADNEPIDDVSNAFTEAAQSSTPPTEQSSQTVAPQAAAESLSPTSRAFAAAERLGLDISSYKDEESLVEGLYRTLEETRKSYQEAQPYVDYARQVLPYDQKIREIVSGQAAPKEEPKPEEEWTLDGHFSKAWQAPEYLS